MKFRVEDDWDGAIPAEALEEEWHEYTGNIDRETLPTGEQIICLSTRSSWVWANRNGDPRRFRNFKIGPNTMSIEERKMLYEIEVRSLKDLVSMAYTRLIISKPGNGVVYLDVE